MSNKFASGVYQIKNVASGKMYIGSSVSVQQRFRQHKSALRRGKHQNSHLQSAWNLYGEQVFIFEQLIICSPTDMRFYEQLMLDGFMPEYNQSKSAYAGVPAGSVCSEAHKAKVGVASKSHWQKPEYRIKVVQAIQDAMTTSEKEKRSQRTVALWENPEYRENATAARRGKAYSVGYKCTPAQVLNRKKAARISNMKRNYGADWKQEYQQRYPMHVGDIYEQ